MIKKPHYYFLILMPLVFGLLAWGVVSSAIHAQAAGTIHYVKVGSDGSHDCLDWDNACDLQTALSLAGEGDEIWVAKGTYKPTKSTDRAATFALKTGVKIYGGFPAAGGNMEDRDWEVHTTTLSGDIGTSGDKTDNSYHVVTAIDVDETALLDGFTITGGNADSDDGNQGDGGGIYNASGSPNLVNVTISDNSAKWYGGGMYNSGSSPSLTDVTISGNSASYNGGGIYNTSGSPSLINVTISDNSAEWFGGGIYNISGSPSLINVTISDNSAELYGGGGIYNTSGSPTMINGILWANTPDQIYSSGGTTSVTYSVIQGDSVYPGEGNLNTDPLLQDLADNGGFTLTHALSAGSSAIDTANPDECPAFDQRNHPRPIDGDGDGIAVCDIGAYEFDFENYYLFLPLVLR